MKKLSILNMPEDLLEDDLSKVIANTQHIQPTAMSQNKKSSEQVAIESLITEVAQSLDIDTQELSEWMSDHSIPTEVLKTILRTAKRFKLNPLLGHIAWELNNENRWEVYIPIDGWIALIHQEPTFQGITFDQAPELGNGIPIWVECTIYCSNLSHPITVREYFSELKTNHPMWAQMPLRMLRHKTMQQCARLAFGISAQELTISMASSTTQTLPTSYQTRVSHLSQRPIDQKSLLKERLTTK